MAEKGEQLVECQRKRMETLELEDLHHAQLEELRQGVDRMDEVC